MRLLAPSAFDLKLDTLGFDTEQFRLLRLAIADGMTKMKQNAQKLLQENRTAKEEISFLLND